MGNVSSIAASDVYYSHSPLQSYRGLNNWRRMVWQVNEENRGDIARAILYFNLRYGDPLVQAGENMLQPLLLGIMKILPQPKKWFATTRFILFRAIAILR